MNRKGDPFYGAQNTSDIYYISIQLMIDGWGDSPDRGGIEEVITSYISIDII